MAGKEFPSLTTVLRWPCTVAASSLVAATLVHATPVSYTFDLSVDFILAAPADPSVVVGSAYHGSFTLDSAVLQHDGMDRSGDVSLFNLALEPDYAWTRLADGTFTGSTPCGDLRLPIFQIRRQPVVHSARSHAQ